MRRDKKMTGRSFHSGWRLLHNGPREAKPAFQFIAGWSSPVARQAHNLKVKGSNPFPATKFNPVNSMDWRGFYFMGYGLKKKLGNQLATASLNHPLFSGRTAQANPSGQNQTASLNI
jgi:hypothetical protein